MSLPADLPELIQRFIDDRDALQEHEYAQLVEAVNASPDLAAHLYDQLVVDDALSQKLAIDRLHFDAQVQQRVADHLRGEEELNRQADELRSLALSRLEKPSEENRWSWSATLALASALTLFVLVGAGLWTWQRNQVNSLLAKVESVEGQVVIRRVPADNDQYAENDLPLRLGDRLIVADAAAITLRWSDGTQVRLGGGTEAELPSTSSGKLVSVEQGDLSAIVAAQPASQPMIFKTPHADAIVRGTELSLHVSGEDTRLDVIEGVVELIEHETSDSQLVASSESAVATQGQRIARQGIRWPTSRDGMIYLFSRDQRLFRSGSMLKPTSLELRGDGASFGQNREMELTGGWMSDSSAARDVGRQLQSAPGFTIEMVIELTTVHYDDRRTVFALEGERGMILAMTQQSNLLELTIADDAGEPKRFVLTHVGQPSERKHVVITCAEGNIRSYEGGMDTGSTGRWEKRLSSSPATRLVFGGNQDDSTRWQGKIAGLAIYDRALTPAEINANVAGYQQ